MVCQEFINQYQEEIRDELPYTEFMKGLEEPKVYYKNEVGFLTIIVQPLWESVNMWLHPNIDHCLGNIQVNTEAYQKHLYELQNN